MAANAILNANSVVLVSGGGRGITARCVIRLAQEAQSTFILLGRSALEPESIPGAESAQDENALKQVLIRHAQSQGEKPRPARIQAQARAILASREVRETLRAVEDAGGKAEYLVSDVTNFSELTKAVAQAQARCGKVTGILHGAGNLADKLLDQKTAADFEKVFSAKVDGLDNLLACVDPQDLTFLVLFSSIVGFYGNPGQADYAMANEVLNKFAYKFKKNYPACRVLSMGWGPWDGGMVTPALRKTFEEHQVRIIPSDAGAELLVRNLTSEKDPGVQILVGDPPPNLATGQDQQPRDYEVRRHLSLDLNPFLSDHQIGEHPVLPATCAAVWAASAAEQLNPQHTFVSISNYKVLKGIVFDDNLPPEFTLSLKEISRTDAGEIAYDARISSLNVRGKPVFNYSLSIQLALTSPEVPVLAIEDGDWHDRERIIEGSHYYANGTLFHGPSFRGVEKLLLVSREKVVMQVRLPAVPQKIQGQFPVQTGNPFVYDAIVQSLLIWAQQYYKAPCLPSSMEKLEQFKAIPFDQPLRVTLEITHDRESSVAGNLLVQSLSGKLYARITRLVGTISPLLNRFIGARS